MGGRARGWSPALLLGVLAVLAATVPARATLPGYLDASAANLPADLPPSKDVTLADVDGDGDLDAYLAGAGRLLLNDCGAVFTDATAERIGAPPTAEAALWADVDGDGATDLVLSRMGQNRLYLNDGNGYFLDATAAHLPVDAATTKAAAAVDVDGDGDLDLVFANGDAQPDLLYINAGDGRFRDETTLRLPRTAAFSGGIAVVDLEEDGDPDLFLSTEACGWDLLYRNVGEGFFTEESGTRLMIAGRDSWSQGAAAGDFDGDTRTDIYVPEGSANCHGTDLVLLHKGSYLQDRGSEVLPAEGGRQSRSATAADLDGDGDLDLAVPQPPNLLLLENDGDGRFTRSASGVALPLAGVTMRAAAGDLDQDGDLDLFVTYLDAAPSLFLADAVSGGGGPAEVSGPGQDPLRARWEADRGLLLSWHQGMGGGLTYNIYQGVLGEAGSHRPVTGLCHLEPSGTGSLDEDWTAVPTGGGSFYYLVTASGCAGEGTTGTSSDGTPRTARSVCGGT